MKKFNFCIFVFALLSLAGCGMTTPKEVPNFSDLSACGDFPTSTGDGGPTTRYFVCRDSVQGECYYAKTYFEQIPGCDPEFDKNPYGKEECFQNKRVSYGLDGKPLQAVTQPQDVCENTTQMYFESKVSE